MKPETKVLFIQKLKSMIKELESERPDPHAELKASFAAGKVIEYYSDSAKEWRDCRSPGWFDGTKYRIKPDPIRVPLGPDDVPPGSVLKPKFGSETSRHWQAIEAVDKDGVAIATREWRSFIDLNLSGWQINHSIPLTGKWNPDSWEPCSKDLES